MKQLSGGDNWYSKGLINWLLSKAAFKICHINPAQDDG
jgi:hypothetical protein